MLGETEIANDAANKAAAVLTPQIPGARVYVDERDDTTLPHALIYVEAFGASGAVMYDGTLVAHVWGRSYFEASSLADRLHAALIGFHALEDGNAYRVKRPGRSYLREDDAAHVTARFPIRFDAAT
jgi:hypothetical protein